MKRLARPLLILFALASVFTGIALTPVTAGATGGACGNFFDTPGTIYTDRNYGAGVWGVYDTSTGGTDYVKTDIQALDYTSTGSDGLPAGHCYIAYRISGWNTTADSWHMYLRVWVCGHQEPDDQYTFPAGGSAQMLSGQYDGYSAGGGAIGMWVSTFGANATFIDSSGCGPQADNYYTSASNVFWSASPSSYISGGVGSAWYCNVPEGGADNFCN